MRPPPPPGFVDADQVETPPVPAGFEPAIETPEYIPPPPSGFVEAPTVPRRTIAPPTIPASVTAPASPLPTIGNVRPAREPIRAVPTVEAAPATPPPRATFTPPTGTLAGRVLRRGVADPLVALSKGIVGLPQGIVGLADIPTGGRVGKAIEEFTPIQFRETQDAMSGLFSPQQKEAQRRVSEAGGFVPTVTEAVKNPSTIVSSVLQSVPSMIGGGGIGRGLLRLAPKLAPVVAAGIGEGAVTAGQIAETIREQAPSGVLTPKQSALVAGAGVMTGIIGVLGGKLAARLGIQDVDVLAAGARTTPEAKGNVVKRVIEGAVQEGAFEELPQSIQEQILQNEAQGKPWNEGLSENAVMGLMAGGVMGGAAQIYRDTPPEVQYAELQALIQKEEAARQGIYEASIQAGMPEEEARLIANAENPRETAIRLHEQQRITAEQVAAGEQAAQDAERMAMGMVAEPLELTQRIGRIAAKIAQNQDVSPEDTAIMDRYPDEVRAAASDIIARSNGRNIPRPAIRAANEVGIPAAPARFIEEPAVPTEVDDRLAAEDARIAREQARAQDQDQWRADASEKEAQRASDISAVRQKIQGQVGKVPVRQKQGVIGKTLKSFQDLQNAPGSPIPGRAAIHTPPHFAHSRG